MNQLRARAKSEGLLKSLYAVLDCELESMEAEKNREIVKFEELSNDEIRLQKYQKDSGLTKDICNRILTEVKHDRETCNKFRMLLPEENAVYGERDLKTLYRVDSQVREVWKGMKGQKPVDLIVLGLRAEETLLGDCKFGLKRDDPWISKYRRLICLLSPITKIAVITVSKDNQTIADLRFQLEIIVGFIFVRHGLRGVGRIAFKENISQLLENMF